jgi:hypothetical protein
LPTWAIRDGHEISAANRAAFEQRLFSVIETMSGIPVEAAPTGAHSRVAGWQTIPRYKYLINFCDLMPPTHERRCPSRLRRDGTHEQGVGQGKISGSSKHL